VAWNIVTSLTQSEAQNFGRDEHLDHEFRYQRANEFVEATLSCGPAGIPTHSCGKASGVFADPLADPVCRPRRGSSSVPRGGGPLNVPHSPQGRPVLIPGRIVEHRKRISRTRWRRRSSRSIRHRKAGRAYYEDIKYGL